MDIEQLKRIIEGALLASAMPLSLVQLDALFEEDEKPGQSLLKQALAALDSELEGRAIELVEVSSGYRIQVRTSLMPRIAQLWAEKPPKYSRALLETLAIIAYRQPITRAEIEQIRGVSLSSNILRTLQDRDWIKVIGHRDVPGRPELLGTTRAFLDYFNLKSLNELPTLAEIKDLDDFEPQLELNNPELIESSISVNAPIDSSNNEFVPESEERGTSENEDSATLAEIVDDGDEEPKAAVTINLDENATKH